LIKSESDTYGVGVAVADSVGTRVVSAMIGETSAFVIAEVGETSWTGFGDFAVFCWYCQKKNAPAAMSSITAATAKNI